MVKCLMLAGILSFNYSPLKAAAENSYTRPLPNEAAAVVAVPPSAETA
ncbi:MAG: hypothetical protein MUC95_00245 [Spirochaetes bacterium]|nr:hypothetical protein [Spirochaetota bacterium]